MNQQAQEWFGAFNGNANLERMARQARPENAFLSLCSLDGQVNFSLGGRIVEGTSFSIPNGTNQARIITLKHPQFVLELEEGELPERRALLSDHIFDIFDKLSQNVAAHLDLDSTLTNILVSLERLLPSDFSEINLFNPEKTKLISYQLTDSPDIDRKIKRSKERYISDDGLTGFLITNRRPLLISEIDEFKKEHLQTFRQDFAFQSYMGILLIVSNELIGTIELACLVDNTYTPNDLELLKMLSGQAAVAIQNASTYDEKQRRTTELASLAQVVQAVSSMSNTRDLYSRLVEAISPLLDVEILGFLVYDENRNLLEGQVPFQGISTSIIEWMTVSIAPGTDAERVWSSQETIVADDAPSDTRIQAIGLDHLAQAAGIVHCVITPLTSSGRLVGNLLVADKLDGSGFEQSDLRLIEIIAGQAAPIIDNSALVQQSQRRAQRAETLRRIASLTGSSATLDEILKYSLQDLARLLRADQAAIYLLDNHHGELRLHENSLFGAPLDSVSGLERITSDDPQFRHTVTESLKHFVSNNLLQDSRVLPIYQPFIDAFNIRSAIIVPLIIRNRGVGELMIGSIRDNYFQHGDIQSTLTAASQISSAIEKASLYSQTDESLRRRLDQLTSLTRISRELNRTLDLGYLLELVYEEALRTTQADCGTIFLLDVAQSNLNQTNGNQAQTPEISLHFGDSHDSKLHPLEEIVFEKGESLVVMDFDQPETIGEASEHKNGILLPAHKGIRASLIVPIAYQKQVAGIIHLHAKNPNWFDQASKDIAEALAIQAAIAIGNANRYQEQIRQGESLSRRADTLSRIYDVSQSLQNEHTLEQKLEDIAFAIQGATPFESVLISVYEPESNLIRRIIGAGISLADMADLQAQPHKWDSITQILQPEFRIGNAYFIPHERLPAMPPDIHSVTIFPEGATSPSKDPADQHWHPQDILVIPLYGSDGHPLGLISVDAPRDKLRPDQPTIEALEILCGQAAYVIEYQYHLNYLKSQVESTQAELRHSRAEGQSLIGQSRQFELKGSEQIRTINHLKERVHRIRAGMDIAEIVNRQGNRLRVLQAFGQGLITHMNLDAALIVEPGSHGPHLLSSMGDIHEDINLEALLGQRNPLNQCLQGSPQILVSHLNSVPEWSDSQLLQALNAEGFICIPIQINERLDSALLALSLTPLPPFSSDDEQLFAVLTRQVSVTLQNLDLLTETSLRLTEVNHLLDFSRQISHLESNSISQALLDSALHLLPAAQAGIVALWDDQQALLMPQIASGYQKNNSLLRLSFQAREALPGRVFANSAPERISDVDFAQQYQFSTEKLLLYRDATGGKLPLSALALPLAKSPESDPVGVILLENFSTTGAFNSESQNLIAALAQQGALILENTRLYQAAKERANQMQSLAKVATIISSNLHTDQLIESLLDQMQAIVPYTTGTLWLRNEDEMIVRAARGFTDEEQRIGLSTNIEDSQLIKEMIASGEAISIGDITADPRFPTLVEPQNLSWLGLPLIATGEVIGVIALEMTGPDFYTAEHIQIATTFSSQAAVAIENANLFQQSVERAGELDQRSQRLEMLNRLSRALSQSLDLDNVIELTIHELDHVIQCSCISVILFDKRGKAHLHAELPGHELNMPIALPEAGLFERLRHTLGIFKSNNISQDQELEIIAPLLEKRNTRSLLALSLGIGNELLGVILIHDDQPNRFTQEEVDLARTICNQSSIAIQNARLYAETHNLTQELDLRVQERTEQLTHEAQRTAILLKIITELSASLDLKQVLNRTLNVLNEVVKAETVIVAIERQDESAFEQIAFIGNSLPLASFQNTIKDVMLKREPLLSEDVSSNPQWIEAPDSLEDHLSLLCAPLLFGEEPLGAILFTHQQPGQFSAIHMDLISAAANQIAIAVNNAELFNLIRDQSENMGKMARNQQIETQRTRAILEDVADGVLVTDEHMNITLFNDSAETILGLKRAKVLGKSLEHFTGLFGRAALSWMETIRVWSQNPSASRTGETFAEQILLEDGRVVSVHLAPVDLGDAFMGTVSVFRDITHIVEVDRLKSEFVATVSHELRTPMTSIKGYVEILLMGAAGSLNEQQTDFLEIVKNNTERLAILVNDLLDISRIEAKKLNLSMQPLDILQIIEQAILDLEERSQKDDKNMNIVVDQPTSLPRVIGDAERVRQILDNLLENAYLYTAEGGDITLRMHLNEHDIQIDVQDNGIGIPIDIQERVFERFFRGEHAFVLASAGTGLGLSIVQHLVELHKGAIWLTSAGEPGEGSTFSFTLPIYTPKNG